MDGGAYGLSNALRDTIFVFWGMWDLVD